MSNEKITSSKLVRKSTTKQEMSTQNQQVDRRQTITQNRLSKKTSSANSSENALLTSAPLSMQNTMQFINEHNEFAKNRKHDDIEAKPKTENADTFFTKLANAFRQF